MMVATGMAVVVGVWRLAFLGQLSDAIYVAAAILIGMMPKTVARLRTFIGGAK